jgi:hypothetical protein
MLERDPKRGVEAHRRSHQQGALDPERVHNADHVAREVAVSVRGAVSRRGGAPVAARVVSKDAKAAVLELRRAHDDELAR